MCIRARFYLDLMRGDSDDADSHRRFYDEYNAVLLYTSDASDE